MTITKPASLTQHAAPPGKATLNTWRVFGPSAMRERFIETNQEEVHW